MALDKANHRIYRAWQLKDEFEQFWEYKAPWVAERFIRQWMTSALRSRLDPMRKFVNTLKQHYDGVLAFVGCRLTNAVAEASTGSSKSSRIGPADSAISTPSPT
jgi:transposase